MTIDDGVELDTERLILRPLTSGDAPRLASIANDVRIARNLTDAFPHPYRLEDAVGFIESGPNGLAITVRSPKAEGDDGTADATLIGVVGGRRRDGVHLGVHTFGYWLGVDSWGNGYATEAARAYVAHVGADPDIHRIEASVFAWNPASVRVLSKAGLAYEGRRPRRITRFSEVTDELLYGLTF